MALGVAAEAAMGAATSPARTTAPAVMEVLLRTNGDDTEVPFESSGGFLIRVAGTARADIRRRTGSHT
jgi:hypothetical protein